MATRYRKKPVEIEAMQLREDTTEAVGDWLDGLVPEVEVWPQYDGTLDIGTDEGVMHASLGDWIIRGVAGEIYPCKPDIFAATYEPVEQGGDA